MGNTCCQNTTVNKDIFDDMSRKSKRSVYKEESDRIESKNGQDAPSITICVPFADYEVLKFTKQKLDNTGYIRPQRYDKEKRQIGFYQYIDDNSLYYGHFQNGKKDGHGIIIYTDQIIYEGDFQNDETKGYGVYIFEDDSHYIGQVNECGPNGKGSYFGATVKSSHQNDETYE